MTQIDTSAEAVERLAAEATSEARDVDVAATLRAPVVDRMRARDEVAGWAGVAAGKDDVIHKLKADLDHLAAICRDLIKAGNDWESRLLQVEDDIVGTYHPEFGTFWRDDGEGYRLLKQARREGMEEAAQLVDCGCDIREAVLARLESQGEKRASYLCPRGDVCCALQAASLRAAVKGGGNE